MRLETLSDHCLTDAWAQKERHLAAESDIVRLLLLKRKCVPSPRGVRGKHPCTNPQGDTCAVQLIGSSVRQTLHFTDGIQLTGSPIRWDDAGLDSQPNSTDEDVCLSALLPNTKPLPRPPHEVSPRVQLL